MSSNFNKMKKMEHWKVVTLLLMIYDFVAVVLSYFAALLIRFDFRFSKIDSQYLQAYCKSIWIYAAFCVVLFWFMRLYKSIWRFASYAELLRVLLSTVISSVVYIVVMSGFVQRMPVSYYVCGIACQFLLTLGIRFSYRFILLLRTRADRSQKEKNVMLIGAGAAGQMIFRDIKHAKETNEKVACFIDDNPNKWGRYIDDVPVFGGRDSIMEAVEKFEIEKIYVALPSAKPEDKRDIIQVCSETHCELMNLPGMYQLYTGEVAVSKMKTVQIEDLLGRDPIKPDMTEVFQYIKGKVVLITGVGSIGSELARQIASHQPKHLILFDVYENNAYDIQLELKKKYPEMKLDTIIGSVRDSRKIFQVFEKYRPEIVYHAAAHKHVPLMEDSPNEAIKNNVLGTWNVAKAADAYHAKKMVLISTDKAVRPTNIMGASKRVCELIVQSFAQTSKTEYAAVRFGNVLGSNGSVVPLFQKQIAHGGPVTVTHPDIIRYFMTIPEAVHLVLQCGALAEGGEIFILDMGEPVKILDLAENMIRLSGLEPGKDIPITFTGLRPGEKLYEELLISLDNLKTTENKQIFVAQPAPVDAERTQRFVRKLVQDAFAESDHIREEVQRLVPEYTPERTETQSAQQPVSIRKDKANVYAAQ